MVERTHAGTGALSASADSNASRAENLTTLDALIYGADYLGLRLKTTPRPGDDRLFAGAWHCKNHPSRSSIAPMSDGSTRKLHVARWIWRGVHNDAGQHSNCTWRFTVRLNGIRSLVEPAHRVNPPSNTPKRLEYGERRTEVRCLRELRVPFFSER